MEERKEELAKINTLETGKLMSASLWEVGVCEDMLNYYADHAEELLKPVYVDNPIKTMSFPGAMKTKPSGWLMAPFMAWLLLSTEKIRYMLRKWRPL